MLLIFVLLFLEVIDARMFSYNGNRKMLNVHNQIRSEVSQGKYSPKDGAPPFPRASNMLKMGWSDSLAEGASEYARECPMKHSTGDYGENIIRITNSVKFTDEQIVQEAVMQWFQELNTSRFDSMTFRASEQQSTYGHATQLIWHSTHKIGCGVHHCDEYTVSVVCRYEPKGNMDGDSIYESGKICQSCPEETTCVSGLCDYNE